VIVLDENISAAEEAKLIGWGIRCRTIGVHVASKGDADADLLSIRLTLARPTFFSHDQDFWDQSRQHSRYCLVWLDTEESEQAHFIRAFLRHSEFDTHAKRLCKVVRVHPDGLTCHHNRHGKPKRIAWVRSARRP
jgi:hypothetical protein